jgi:hypothetical protein
MDDDSKPCMEKITMDLCVRIEKMCRYSPLDEIEVREQEMDDRGTVAGLYAFYKRENDSPEVAARKARASAIRLLLREALQ